MNQYDAQLKTLREKIGRKAKIQSMLKSLREQAADLGEQARALDGIRLKEQADADRLERPGLTALLLSVWGRREERLDREKAEALAAAAKYNAAARQAQAVEEEIRALESEYAALAGAEADYDRVLAEKTQALRKADVRQAGEIGRMEEEQENLSSQCREIDEALRVGQDALREISVIQDNLDSAEGWGVWDLMGGGLISSMVKHDLLDEAQNQITQLQITLRRYRTELSDVTVHADVQAQVEGFLRFADHFFDGIFVDWAVLDSIHDAQRNIAQTRGQVEEVQGRLEGRRSSLAARAERLRKALEDLVLNA